MLNIILIGVGGFIGAVTRFLISAWVGQKWGRSFPIGTFVVNITGCFFIGLAMTLFTERILASPSVRLFLTVGFLGAFTTFSTFEYETGSLLYDGEWLLSVANIVLSVGFGLVALKAGELIARRI
ncbi:Fluoride ion transporter CrcB [hydrothermal vent metagenome]|uniref:Fluoride ion transporter CrcB n=1 Tax=hydrothermal vent metagenome TaxID=652676 RepID=A0A3B1D6E9_9ZZZZ|nr:MAG: putative fluoride ion transporter CrcB [bacterium]